MATKKKITQFVLSSWFAIALIFLTIGCGSVQHNLKLDPNYQPKAGMKVEVGSVTNETGEKFDVEAEKMLSDAFAEALRENDLLWTGQMPEKLVIQSKIIEYEKGNAFKRWLLPGWGSTVLTIHSDLTNGTQVVGSAEARRTVSIGGGYTIGAWRTIFAKSANDIVDDLKRQMQK
jgi:hypothetical protein